MAKGAYIGVNGVARKIKKGYVGVDGVARKIKKAYIGIGGVARLCWSGELEITYSGNMTDQIVTMSGQQYRLLTLTSSGTLTVSEPTPAEVWMCGGGTSGNVGNSSGSGGGAGAYTKQGNVTLSGSMAAVIGAGGATAVSGSSNVTSVTKGFGYNWGGASSFGGLQTSNDYKWYSNSRGLCGGTGGGNASGYTSADSNAGWGDGIDKHPFLDSTYFTSIPCAGGGAGGCRWQSGSVYRGGAGGTNGGHGGSPGTVLDIGGGAGGATGGGAGGSPGRLAYDSPNSGSAATYYGSGGGGGGYNWNESSEYPNGGAGYQGVIYIRIPV